jgi:hypothetical protein
MALAQLLEQYVSLGIFVVAVALAGLSLAAWRRERDRRMAAVTAAYAMFGVYGLFNFLEYVLLPYFSAQLLELLEHGSAVFILSGLLVFFLALTRD